MNKELKTDFKELTLAERLGRGLYIEENPEIFEKGFSNPHILRACGCVWSNGEEVISKELGDAIFKNK